MQYTVEVYKRDLRRKTGYRLTDKVDYDSMSLQELEQIYGRMYPQPRYRVAIHETYVTRTNLMSGTKFQERYDTSYYCSPSSETYWSM